MIREISSLQHPLVKHLVKLRSDRSYRSLHQSVLLEGTKLINEICQELPASHLLILKGETIPLHLRVNEVLLVTKEIIQKISGVEQPEKMLAEIALPKFANLAGKRWILALDKISDPGNLGNLLRTALALNWEGVFLIDECVDPFNDKAIRAAKGATFKLPIQKGSWQELKELSAASGLTIAIADIEGETPHKLAATEGLILVLGNESRGSSEKDEGRFMKVSIPMSDKMESLNVASAGSILLYLFRTFHS